MRAAIVGIAGTVLTAAEAAAFSRYPPAGVILFSRNVEDPRQLGSLVGALRRALPADAVLMVDQEGGRVARLRPPHWPSHPPAGSIGGLHSVDPQAGLRAAFVTGALIGLDAAEVGLDVVCAPVLDRRLPGATDAIGDRAFAADPASVAALGRAMADGLLATGVQPVMKHAPGHGRARLDTHIGLPTVNGDAVEADADLLPFRLNADLPWAMTAHILYPAWDAALPATLSAGVIGAVIRRAIGFEGVLVTDDLAMHALSGRPADLALAALAAGCDLALYCTGEADPTVALLAACPATTQACDARLGCARALVSARRLPLDRAVLTAERDRLLA